MSVTLSHDNITLLLYTTDTDVFAQITIWEAELKVYYYHYKIKDRNKTETYF